MQEDAGSPITLLGVTRRCCWSCPGFAGLPCTDLGGLGCKAPCFIEHQGEGLRSFPAIRNRWATQAEQLTQPFTSCKRRWGVMGAPGTPQTDSPTRGLCQALDAKRRRLRSPPWAELRSPLAPRPSPQGGESWDAQDTHLRASSSSSRD